MMNYVIKENGGSWDVYETRTEQVVKTCSTICEAQVVKTHLNLGGGFDSWTPSFFLKNNFEVASKSC